MKNRFTLLLLVLFTHVICAQSTFYVSPAGSNANAGTLVSPWQTVQYALDNVTAGSTIYLMGGTYTENCYASVSGTSASNRITLTNYNNQVAVIDGGSAPGILLELDNVSYFTVSGIEFKNCIGNDATGILLHGISNGVSIINNKIHDIHFSSNASDIPNASTNAQPLIVYGDSLISNDQLLISNNEIYFNRTGFSEALAVNGNVTDFAITGNSVHDNSNIGIDVIGYEGTCPNPGSDQARLGSIKWNVTWNNISNYATSAGIYLDGAGYCQVENNISYGNGYGIEVGCEAVGKFSNYIGVRNNIVYHNLEAGIAIGGYDYPSNSGSVVLSYVGNNTIFDNNISMSQQGELVINYVTGTNIENNIIWTSGSDNLVTCDANSQGLHLDFNCYYAPAGIQFSYNSIPAGSLSAWSVLCGSDLASLNTDPLLVDVSNYNFHVLPLSPCIDAGDTIYTPIAGETDMDTMARLQNGRVEIGADEYGTAVGIISPLLKNFPSFNFDRTLQIVTVTFSEPYNGELDLVMLIGVDGRQIEIQKRADCPGSLQFHVADLPSGTYLLFLQAESIGWKFVK